VTDAVTSDVTAFAAAVNVAVVAPAVTVAAAGTVTAALLLASDTVAPPAGAALSKLTVQFAVPPPRTEPGVQLKAVSCAGAVTVSDADRDELL
jgi:hypothetical protein